MRRKLIVISILLIIMLISCTKLEGREDALKFKKEYESINGEINTYNKKYRVLNIDKNNSFVYQKAKDIVRRVENKETFIVYFGFKECPWCRSMLEEFIRVAKDNNVEKIYYVDVKDIRDVKELDENGEIITKESGDEAYLKLLEYFDNVLENYTLKSDDEEIKLPEKRIYAPNVIAVSKGKAIQMETGTSDKLKDPYMKLTKVIRKDTYNKLNCLIKCLEEEANTCQKTSC